MAATPETPNSENATTPPVTENAAKEGLNKIPVTQATPAAGPHGRETWVGETTPVSTNVPWDSTEVNPSPTPTTGQQDLPESAGPLATPTKANTTTH
jgi:hypothetical protein